MKVVVIGGGPAGMIAAITASKNNNDVLLVEQNEKLGKKLFLTGKGRCNLTNACDTEELFQNIPHNPKFLYSAIYNFDNSAVMSFFEENGLKIKTERGDRVFPASDHSSDVIKTLENVIKRNGVKVRLNTKVTGINVADEESEPRITSVIFDDKENYSCDAVIIATGGASYPTTGSDGKSFDMLTKLGIEIKTLLPSLVPFECPEKYIKDMQGLSLKNVSLLMQVNGKMRYEGFGEMLFTHFGVSGPLVLSASTHLNNDDYDKDIRLSIDLKPALSFEELDKRVLSDFADAQNKNFENAIGKLLPNKMIESVIKLSNIEPTKKVNLISREERHRLISVLKEYPVRVSGNRGFNEAIITRGGVSIKEINPSTMESKKVKGLYFAGEMIDCDAYTGGFNLQIAWSTGRLAGELL